MGTFLVAANDAVHAVKNKADYVCDGADDDVEIQAAINTLPAAGGKVQLSEGTFNISSPLKMVDFTTLQGQGFGTLISAMPTLNNNMIELKNADVEQVVLNYFRMFGLAQQQNAGHAIYFDNTGGNWSVKEPDHYIKNLMISYINQCGVYLKGAGNNASRIVDVFAFVCGEDGFRIEGPDVRVHGCDAGASGWRGFYVKGGASMLSVCKAYYSGDVDVAKGQGFNISGSRIQVLNCQSQDNYSHGFELVPGANRISFVGCQAESNGRDASRANGFQFSAGSRFHLSGCSALDVTTGKNKGQDYGYQIDPNVGIDYIYITGSYGEGNIKGGLNNESAGTHIDTSGLKEW